MPLDAANKVSLLGLSKDSWIDAKSCGYAYQRANYNAKRISNGLKVLTIVAALITAITGIVNLGWLTLIPGLLTSGLAAVESAFTPTKKAPEYANCMIELEKVQDQLTDFSVMVDSMEDVASGTNAHRTIVNRFREIKKRTPVTPSREDKNNAWEDFRLTTMADKLREARRAAGQPLPANEEPSEDQSEDRFGIVAATRPT